MLINSANYSKLIGTIILIISCFLTIVSIFKRDLTVFAKKILGSILIIGIVLFSNHILTYSISVIIVGTLIADSKFLENIWATAFKNKEYFVSNATEEQKRKKIANEINSEGPISLDNTEDVVSTEGNLICNDNIYDERIKHFMELKEEIGEVLIASDLGLFNVSDVRFNVAISNSAGQSVIIDGIAKGNQTNFYCIEIKQSCSLSTLDNSIGQLRKNIKILKKHYENKNMNAKLKGILVVAENCLLDDDFYDDFAILKYNQNIKAFSNREIIKEWIQ